MRLTSPPPADLYHLRCHSGWQLAERQFLIETAVLNPGMVMAVMSEQHLFFPLNRAAIPAVSAQRQVSFGDLQPFFFSQPADDLHDCRSLELDHPLALQAGEVVMWGGRCSLKMTVIFAQAVLSHQPQALQQCQRAVNRRQADARVDGFHLVVDGFGIQVPGVVLQHIQHQLPLAGGAQPSGMDCRLEWGRMVHRCLIENNYY